MVTELVVVAVGSRQVPVSVILAAAGGTFHALTAVYLSVPSDDVMMTGRTWSR